METLAGSSLSKFRLCASLLELTFTHVDLASSQRQQTNRTLSANNVRQPEQSRQLQQPPQRSPSLINPAQAAARAPIFQITPRKSLVDLTMSEAAAQPPAPRVFESKVLSQVESQRVTDLLNYLTENSYAYDCHVELINLLHKGFIAHSLPPPDGSGQQRRDPREYGLLKALRQAREAMDTRFAVGEDIWDDWLSDEVLLATSTEDRIAVTELFQKAVQDEPASVKLWQMYAGWVWINYVACNSKDSAQSSTWTEEDRQLCKPFFTRDLIIGALEQAIASTQWRVDESHVVWNRYAELVQEDFPSQPTSKEIERLRNMYVARLQFPHATWEETSQMFWSIVSKYEGSNWESIMQEVQQLTGTAKSQMSQREPHEASLRRALESGDKDAIFNQFTQYLNWERKREWKQRNRSAFDRELRSALFERALLRFPTYTDWWIDYVDFVINSNPSTPVLPLIERATRHCPWSGDLWARRILQSAVEGKTHQDIEATKHRATNSGLLDTGGLEEMVKVLQQWCSYLRRHAFSTTATEDDLDTAEVGITMALEDVQQAGTKIYGKDFQGDPLFRLEAIQVKFLSQARRFDDARKIYQSLAKLRKNSYDFWMAYYHWELWIWGYDRIKEAHRVETMDNGPDRATAVLQEALSQRDLDWPEKVADLYLNHFQQHESGVRLRAALVEAREFLKHIAYRRQAEASEAAQQQPVQQTPIRPVEAPPQIRPNEPAAGEKRKRNDELLPNGHGEKRSRTESVSTLEAVPEIAAPDTDMPAPESELPEPLPEPSASASAQIKRDREHNTITVKDLPPDVQELDVKKFFRDVGVPLSINILVDKDAEMATATVEFETHEDVLAAKTRSGKQLRGYEVRIQSGTQSTLYVANYPPEFDEVAIRKLFEGYGDVVSVRFPSLKYNNRRRFCYVQFLTQDEARAAAAAMDEKMLDGSHRLLAKISDPDAKKQRSGATAEGRELIVKNIERNAPDNEIRQFFESYGTVVSMNLVRLVSGKKTGTGFIVFSTAEEATAALDADKKPFYDRILHVEFVSAKGRAAPMERAKKEDIIVSRAASATPDPTPETVNGARRGSDVSMGSNIQVADESYRTAKERKVAIFHLPDTVNDARIRAAMEEHGPLVKIQMRRQDQGAIVEFENVKDAFHVRQGVDCSALGPDVITGDVADLLARVKKRQESQGGSEAVGMKPTTISRPAQRGGRRGGLGFKRGGAFGAGRGGDGALKETAGAAKSNADFRSMFAKGKEEAASTDG